MNKFKKTSILAFAIAVIFQGCSTQNQNGSSEAIDSLLITDMHNSENSVDWMGTYKGALNCPDCDSIEYAVTLSTDNSYSLKKIFRGKSSEVVSENGKFTWFDNGSKIQFDNSSEIFQVGENKLFTLNSETQKFNPEQSLEKINGGLTDIHWKLITLNGKDIRDLKLMREPFVLLMSGEKRISANGGCNNLFGSYTLNEENFRLTVSQLASTKMACENMKIEDELGDVLSRMDSYHLANDTLQLFKGRMAPLAVLVANYDNL